MSDLVERLYDLHERFIFQGGSEFARNIADEMMALRTKAHQWESVFGHLGTADEVGNEWVALKDEVESLKKHLAASQAREAQLRETLEACKVFICNTPKQREAYGALYEALAPHDDTALRERLKAERERCAKVCATLVDANQPAPFDEADEISCERVSMAETCVAAIRNLGDE